MFTLFITMIRVNDSTVELNMENGKPKLYWYEDRCIRCGLCVGVCPFDALTLEAGMIKIDHEKCTLCGLCVKGCPVLALEIKKELEKIAEERGVKLEV